MNILVVGDFRYNGGSSHAVFNYCRVAPKFGCEIRISSTYGSLDTEISHYIPVCSEMGWADQILFVFESYIYLTEQQVKAIRQNFSREQITVMDPDGRYGNTVSLNGDSNHTEYSRDAWAWLYESLSDRIFQNRLSEIAPGTQFFSFFGMEQPNFDRTLFAKKLYTIQYVGNNWYRWLSVRDFLTGLQPVRQEVGRIALRGKWWDGNANPGLEKYTYADIELLQDLQVEVGPSVPFNSVISSMSEALISPIFVRPMLSAQHGLTPRMFETLCSETIPIFGEDDIYIAKLYGAVSNRLCFRRNPAEKVLDIVRDPDPYFALVWSIRDELFSHYNYEKLFSRFLYLLSS